MNTLNSEIHNVCDKEKRVKGGKIRKRHKYCPYYFSTEVFRVDKVNKSLSNVTIIFQFYLRFIKISKPTCDTNLKNFDT